MFENQFYIEDKYMMIDVLHKTYCNDVLQHILSFIKFFDEDEYYNEQDLLMYDDDI